MYTCNWSIRNGLEVLSHIQLHVRKKGNVQTNCMTKKRWKRKKNEDKNHHLPQVYQKCHLLLKPALF